MLKIPLKQVPSQKFRVVLGGQNCTINLYYRFGNTYMDLVVGDGVVINGAVCRNRSSVVNVANHIFAGALYFLDLLGDSDPDYKLFNDRYILLYVSASESTPGGLLV